MPSPALDDQFQGGSAYLAGHAGNVIQPANALLMLELTADTSQGLVRPASQIPAGLGPGRLGHFRSQV